MKRIIEDEFGERMSADPNDSSEEEREKQRLVLEGVR